MRGACACPYPLLIPFASGLYSLTGDRCVMDAFLADDIAIGGFSSAKFRLADSISDRVSGNPGASRANSARIFCLSPRATSPLAVWYAYNPRQVNANPNLKGEERSDSYIEIEGLFTYPCAGCSLARAQTSATPITATLFNKDAMLYVTGEVMLSNTNANML